MKSDGLQVTPSRETIGCDGRQLVAEGLLSVYDAAAFLSVSRSKLYEMMDQGLLPFVKLGRSRRVPRRALVELAAGELRGGYRT
jgi:excisionase family DNA binding protein